MGRSTPLPPPPDPSAARRRLEAERRATVDRVAALASEVAGIVAASEGANADDEHDPEGSTIAFERARVDALLARARVDLGQLEQVGRRIDDGSYWTCTACGGPIAPERLEARPATATCIGCVPAVSPIGR